jgi:hypothetical protein
VRHGAALNSATDDTSPADTDRSSPAAGRYPTVRRFPKRNQRTAIIANAELLSQHGFHIDRNYSDIDTGLTVAGVDDVRQSLRHIVLTPSLIRRRSLRAAQPWTPQIPHLCRFSNSVSFRDPLTCGDVGCLTRCHRGFVSKSCHFFRTPLSVPLATYPRARGADNPFRRFRHVTVIPDITHG